MRMRFSIEWCNTHPTRDLPAFSALSSNLVNQSHCLLRLSLIFPFWVISFLVLFCFVVLVFNIFNCTHARIYDTHLAARLWREISNSTPSFYVLIEDVSTRRQQLPFRFSSNVHVVQITAIKNWSSDLSIGVLSFVFIVLIKRSFTV